MSYLKQQYRATHIVENVVGDGTEKDISDFTAAFVSADDEEVKVLAVCDMGNHRPRFSEFEEEFAGKNPPP